MARYGRPTNRGQISPYSSQAGGPMAITDDDYSYITSQDLDDPVPGSADRYLPSSSGHPIARQEEDDVLLLKSKGVTYPAHFPAYSIGDGKLQVRDVRERAGIVLGLPEQKAKHVKLYYKGNPLRALLEPVRDYGVKNKSEILAVMPEPDGTSDSEDEVVIVGDPEEDGKSRRRRKKRTKKKGDTLEVDRPHSPRDSPRDSQPRFDKPKSPVPPRSPVQQSPLKSPVAPKSPTQQPPANTSEILTGPRKVLKDLNDEFDNKWQPLIDEYVASPPSDTKKRVDEHRKISESVLQQILLKLDGVDHEGEEDIRQKRRESVKRVTSALKSLDVAKDSQS